jgi:hypothetical protein
LSREGFGRGRYNYKRSLKSGNNNFSNAAFAAIRKRHWRVQWRFFMGEAASQ